MQIRTRLCMSLDGYVTTPEGWPAQLADPSFVAGESYGFPEFQKSCDAVLMGRTTLEPALGAGRWPWPDMDVFVLGSRERAPRWGGGDRLRLQGLNADGQRGHPCGQGQAGQREPQLR